MRKRRFPKTTVSMLRLRTLREARRALFEGAAAGEIGSVDSDTAGSSDRAADGILFRMILSLSKQCRDVRNA